MGDIHEIILEMTPGGMIYIPGFMAISSSIKEFLGLLPQQCWYY
jgi:hypothetical protein